MLVPILIENKELGMKNLAMLNCIATMLVIIGGLNWGLIGLFDLNIVALIFGGLLSRIIYIIVGVASAYKLYTVCCDCRKASV